MTLPLDNAISKALTGPVPPPLNYLAADTLWMLAMRRGEDKDADGEDALLLARERVLHGIYNIMEAGFEEVEWQLDNA
jgi:hypothetical protein